MQQVGSHTDDFAFEALEAGEQARVQRVAGKETCIRFERNLRDVIASRIRYACGQPLLPTRVTLAGLGQLCAEVAQRRPADGNLIDWTACTLILISPDTRVSAWSSAWR